MNRRFGRINARSYEFKGAEGDRELIALFYGGKRVAFIEYESARRFVDRIHDLCDEHDNQMREVGK